MPVASDIAAMSCPPSTSSEIVINAGCFDAYSTPLASAHRKRWSGTFAAARVGKVIEKRSPLFHVVHDPTSFATQAVGHQVDDVLRSIER